MQMLHISSKSIYYGSDGHLRGILALPCTDSSWDVDRMYFKSLIHYCPVCVIIFDSSEMTEIAPPIVCRTPGANEELYLLIRVTLSTDST
jgi:hypothetical protein